MIVIVEGVDGTGKTTVARILNDLLPLSTLIKLSGAPKEVQDPSWMRNTYYSLAPFLIEMSKKTHVIVDRAWPSEIVYPPLFKGYRAEYLDWWVPRLEGKVDITYCYLAAPVEVLVERARRKQESQPNEEHPSADVIKAVSDAYDKWFYEGQRNSKSSYLLYHTGHVSPQEVAEQIVSDLNLLDKDIDTTYSRLLH